MSGDSSDGGLIGGSSANRRGFMMRAAAAGAATIGASSVASASTTPGDDLPWEDVHAAVAPYRSADVVASLAEGDDVLEEIAEDGFLEEGSAEELGLDELNPATDGQEDNSETFTAREVDGEVTPEIQIRRELEDGLLTYGILPGVGESYAAVNTFDDDEDPIVYQVGSCDCDDCCDCGACCSCSCTSGCRCCGSCTCYWCPNKCECSGCGW